MTDGGEGSINRKQTQLAKDKISMANKGNVSARKGIKLSKEIIDKMSNTKTGKPNLKIRKVIIDTKTNKLYSGVKEAHKDFPEYSLSTLYSYLNGNKKNRSSLLTYTL